MSSNVSLDPQIWDRPHPSVTPPRRPSSPPFLVCPPWIHKREFKEVKRSSGVSDTLCKSLGSEMVEITSRVDGSSITIHKKILCQRSVFFTNALRGGFKEAEENSITVSSITQSSLEFLQRWVYTQRLRYEWNSWGKDFLPDDPDEHASTYDDLVDNLVTLYIFGQIYSIPELQNEVIFALHKLDCQTDWRFHAKSPVIRKAWENREIDGQKALLVEYLALQCARHRYVLEDEDKDDLPKGFLFLVIKRYRDEIKFLKRGASPSTLSRFLAAQDSEFEDLVSSRDARKVTRDLVTRVHVLRERQARRTRRRRSPVDWDAMLSTSWPEVSDRSN